MSVCMYKCVDVRPRSNSVTNGSKNIEKDKKMHTKDCIYIYSLIKKIYHKYLIF